jgi:hypothetical protein
MKTNTRVMPAMIVMIAALATGMVTTTAYATGKSGTDTLNISEYANWGDPAMAKIAVDSGRALVNHLNTTRALLDTDEITQARSALVASREFANTIQRIMPYLTVVEQLQDASNKVVEENITAFKDDMLPIYANLDELQVYAPEVANRTRGMVKQAEKNAEGGNKQRAAKELTETATEIAQHTVYLPVDFVNGQVHVALQALNQKKPDVTVAKRAVNRALDSLTMVIEEVTATNT